MSTGSADGGRFSYYQHRPSSESNIDSDNDFRDMSASPIVDNFTSSHHQRQYQHPSTDQQQHDTHHHRVEQQQQQQSRPHHPRVEAAVEEPEEADADSDTRPEIQEILATDADLHHFITCRELTEVQDRGVWRVSSAKHGNGVHQLLDSDDPESYWQSDGLQPHIAEVQFPKLMPIVAVAILLNYTVDESYTPRKVAVSLGTHIGDMARVITSSELESPNGWLILFPNALIPYYSHTVNKRTGRVNVLELDQVLTELVLDPNTASSLLFPPRLPIPNNHNCQQHHATAVRHLIEHHPDLVSSIVYPSYATTLRVSVLENHQNGRDTHVRGIKVLSTSATSSHLQQGGSSTQNNFASIGLPQPTYTTANFDQYDRLR